MHVEALLPLTHSNANQADYGYGPFGEVVRATGPMAKANPFRFSTKYQDDETDLLYYGYRYYNASTGRWLSRDPIAERGGLNLYGFVGNRPTTFIDVLGREPAKYVNVVMVPSEVDDGDTSMSSLVMDVNKRKDDNNWTVLSVENINDGNRQLKNTKCICINELNLLGHGNNGSQRVGNSRLQVNPNGTVTGLELFAGLKSKFCKPCTVYLRGCKAAKGAQGKTLLKAIANATGCKTKGWTSPTSELTPYQGLPGSGFLGFFAGPDAEADPD